MEKHVYLVRHGESESNVDGIHRAHDAQLTAAGRVQAMEVAARVKKLGVGALVSSDFVRAQDTAAAIAAETGLAAETNALFGEWLEPSENVGRHKDHPTNKAIYQAFLARRHDRHGKHSDEESFHELHERAQACLAFLAEHPAERICVVTHGAFLRVLVGAILFRDEFAPAMFIDMFQRMTTSNTGITYIRELGTGKGWQLHAWNDSAHLG